VYIDLAVVAHNFMKWTSTHLLLIDMCSILTPSQVNSLVLYTVIHNVHCCCNVGAVVIVLSLLFNVILQSGTHQMLYKICSNLSAIFLPVDFAVKDVFITINRALARM